MSQMAEVDSERGAWSQSALLVALLFVVFVALLEVGGVATMFMGGRIVAAHAWIASLVVATLPWFLRTRAGAHPSAHAWTYSLLFLATFAFSLGIAIAFYDFSYDGQAYHQEGVIQLARGWNVVYEVLPADVPGWVWVAHYSKGPWMAAACVYAMTGAIETGKAVNVLLMAGAFFLALATLLRVRRLTVPWCVALATLAALNPVSIYQAVSFYVDGQLAALLTMLVAVLVLAVRVPRVPLLMPLASLVVVLLVSVKFTGAAYAVVFGSAYVVAVLAVGKWHESRGFLAGCVGTFLLSFFVIGYNPHVTNWQSKGHPFFPVFGEGRIDVTGNQTPGNILPANRLTRLALSVFSRSSGVSRDGSAELKFPLAISKDEITSFASTGTRVAGFGPLFAAALVVLVGALAAMRVRESSTTASLIVAGCIVATALIHSEGWWARYAPQLWLVPIVLCVPLGCAQSRAFRACATIAVGLLVVNLTLVTAGHVVYQVRWSTTLRAQLEELARYDTAVDTFFGEMESNRIRLQEAGVAYRRIASPDGTDCPHPIRLVQSHTTLCPVEG